jgi:hypothetical protein
VLPAAVLGLVLLLLGVLAVVALRAFGSLPAAEEAAGDHRGTVTPRRGDERGTVPTRGGSAPTGAPTGAA